MTDKHQKREESPVDKPHDKLIRRLLGNENNARDIIDAYLPKEVKALLDLTYLERQPDTFIDAQHRLHAVDILFKTRCKNTGKEAYIWVLIEQQRDPDIWMPLRMFCYIAVIWDNLRKKNKSRAKSVKIPFIYPLIISNASKPYSHSLTLRDMIEPEEAKPLFDKLFTTPIHMIDLAAITDDEMREKLQEHVRAQALLLSLKHIYDDNLQALLENLLIYSLQALEKMGSGDDVADLLYYIYNEGNLTDPTKFLTFLHQRFSKDVEEKVMTLGQQATYQARQEGINQGLQESALRMIKRNMDIDTIIEITGLSREEIKRLAQKVKRGY